MLKYVFFFSESHIYMPCWKQNKDVQFNVIHDRPLLIRHEAFTFNVGQTVWHIWCLCYRSTMFICDRDNCNIIPIKSQYNVWDPNSSVSPNFCTRRVLILRYWYKIFECRMHLYMLSILSSIFIHIQGSRRYVYNNENAYT